jgi:hypothetical protein
VAEGEWRREIRRLFEAGRSIEEIAAAAGVRYDVVFAIVRPRSGEPKLSLRLALFGWFPDRRSAANPHNPRLG